MDLHEIRHRFADCTLRCLMALLCAALLVPGDSFALVRWQDTPAAEGDVKIPPDQLDSLVAPIALYPDNLLAQVLAASTYPLEIVQLQQFLDKNKGLKDKALTEAVQKQNWDPSVQAMAPIPDVVKRLADDIKWTTDLGNAFLAQQSDVMDAVQRMRKKAKDKGTLQTNEQQKVETQVVESKQVIVVQQSNPEVVYVPSYNPTVVYGPPPYPYPPVYYPPPPPAGAYVATAAISFGVGMMVGAAWSGGWGYGCGWGHNDVNVNVNNNYVNNYNKQNINNKVGGGNNTFQHNPQHRGGAPYSNSATAGRYGGTTRGSSASARQASAQRNVAQQGSRGGAQAGTMDRGGADRGGAQAGSMDRGGADRGGSRSGGAGVSDMSSNRGGGGGDRVGSRSTSPSASSRDSGAFGGASSRTSGSSARASSSRGSSSFGGGSRGGGGGRSGGGGRR